MAVGKATAITAAILGAVMLAGVRGDVRARAEPTMPLGMSQAVKRLRGGVTRDFVAEGFQTAEDFAATVHASRNIRVPFTALKHQVVDERQTLATAIHAVKPTANASLEADLARSEARADLEAIN
jgi:hypothetical protein